MKMRNKFIYSNNYKRYHTYDYYLNQKYGGKVAKVALNAGFSCPHITSGGCIFCAVHNKIGKLLPPEEIRAQFQEKKQALSKKWKDTKYIAYFQASSNTFAELADLKEIYESVLHTENLVGLDIATRPDCVTREVAEYLAELSAGEACGRPTDISVELGLQTCHDRTARFINRGYALETFERAYKILAGHNIPVTLHIINSLPVPGGKPETPGMMTETAKYIANLRPLPLGVKIHQLYVAENTKLCNLYKAGGITLLSKSEYTDTVVKQLELLPPEIVIMRLTGDPDGVRPAELAQSGRTVPEWVQKKFAVINDIDKLMLTRGTYQGKLSGFKYTRAAVNAGDNAPGTPPQNKTLTNMLATAKRLLDISIKENGVYADFTAGKGGDTLYIKKACPSARIYAFDIQAQAIEITKKRLEDEKCLDENIILINDSHANLKKYIKEELDGAVFNLGYLPGSDKSVTTLTKSTFACLSGALEILKPGGVITVSVYPGHEEGAKEGGEILEFAKNLEQKEFDCLYHRLINIPEAPFIIAFQKKEKTKKIKED